MQLGEGLQLRSIWRKHPRIILSVILMPVAQRTNLPFSHLRRPIILLLPPSCEFLLCTRDISLLTKVHIVKAMIFPVVMYRCESWTVKKADCWRIDAFKLWCWRFLRVPWTTIKPVKSINPKGNQSWIFTGKADAEAETPVLWPPDAESWLIGKHPDAGKDWRQEANGTTEDEMVGWHHWLNGHEFG